MKDIKVEPTYPPGMTLQVSWRVETELVLWPPDKSNPRVDTIVETRSGGLVCVAGTPAENPIPPALPAGFTAVAYVRVDKAKAYIDHRDIDMERRS